jgi:hypothetical protein
MTKITVAGETFDYDGAKQPMSEALWIEHVYKRRYAEWQADLEAGSAKALCMLACLIWRRDGRDTATSFQDLLDGKTDFDLQEMLASMYDGVPAAQEEAGEAVPTTPGESPDPDGTHTIATDTSPSSPGNSTSGRSKSGSSTSRTSKRSSTPPKN